MATDKTPEEFIKPFKEKMLKLYLEGDDVNNGWGPYQILQAAIKMKDYDLLTTVLNHEVEEHQLNPKKSRNNYYYGYNYGRNQKLIQPLQFPPNSSKSLPSFIMNMFLSKKWWWILYAGAGK